MSTTEQKQSLFRSVFVFSGLTSLSRVFGYARDAVIFIVFGAGVVTDAFLVAFRLPNFLRRLFGEGALAQALVPVYQETRDKEGDAGAKELLDRATGTLGVILLVITAIGVVAAPILIAIFAPGFVTKGGSSFDLATSMLVITFPYIFFISITALLSAVLNSHDVFFSTAFSPILLNIALIAAAILLAPMLEEPITALAWGVLIAGVIQLAFQVAWMRYRIGVIPRPRWGFAHPAIHSVAKLMTPALLSSAVMQVNLIFDTMIASFLISGSISWLYISDRFVELPLALFGIAISTVILPRLSSYVVAKNREGFDRTLEWGTSYALLLAIPCTVGLILLAGPILIALVQYNEFSAYDTHMASLSLAAYATGLPAFILVKVLSSAFYAEKNPVRPMKIAVLAMFANIVMNITFVLLWKAFEQPAEHMALALATSLAAWLNCILLYRALRQQEKFLITPRLRSFFIKFVLATISMTVVLVFAMPGLEVWDALHHWWQRIGLLLGLVALGAVVYFAILMMAKVRLRDFIHAT